MNRRGVLRESYARKSDRFGMHGRMLIGGWLGYDDKRVGDGGKN